MLDFDPDFAFASAGFMAELNYLAKAAAKSYNVFRPRDNLRQSPIQPEILSRPAPQARCERRDPAFARWPAFSAITDQRVFVGTLSCRGKRKKNGQKRQFAGSAQRQERFGATAGCGFAIHRLTSGEHEMDHAARFASGSSRATARRHVSLADRRPPAFRGLPLLRLSAHAGRQLLRRP